jgi:hypothetical protein
LATGKNNGRVLIEPCGAALWGVENKCLGPTSKGQPISDISGDKMYALKGKTKGC